jgi:hypothetical protein
MFRASLSGVRREKTMADVLLVLVAFVAGSASIACALIVLFQDRESLAALFAVGGLGLALWCGARASLEA